MTEPDRDTGEGAAEAARCSDDHCVTCGDVAESMKVLRIDRARELALCADEGGKRRTVEVALVAPIAEGDRLLVHAGTAIGRDAQGGVGEEVAL